MIDQADWDFGKCEIPISSKLAVTSMSLCLRMDGNHVQEPRPYPISGFPRSLVIEDSLTGKTIQTSVFPSTNGEAESRLNQIKKPTKTRSQMESMSPTASTVNLSPTHTISESIAQSPADIVQSPVVNELACDEKPLPNSIYVESEGDQWSSTKIVEAHATLLEAQGRTATEAQYGNEMGPAFGGYTVGDDKIVVVECEVVDEAPI